jgi:4-hydroxy-2-oxoheptanedioate aldolase
MRAQKLLSTLAEQRLAFGSTVHLRDPAFMEMLALEGYDWASIVLEHSHMSLDDIATLCLAADARGITVLVHPASARDPRILPLLNIGVGGILAPQCESADDARAVVEAARFPPVGLRGAHGAVRSADYGAWEYGDYVAKVDESVIVGVIIETVQGVEHSHEIARVDGLDVVYVGLADLSQSLGVPGQSTHPRVREALKTVSDAVRETKITMGVSDYGWTAEEITTLGVGMLITPSSDVGFIRTQFGQNLRDARGRLA